MLFGLSVNVKGLTATHLAAIIAGHRNRKEDMLKISIAKGALLASGLAGLVLATPAQAQLDQALQTAKRSTAQSAASQQRVADLDDSAEAKQREYRAVLQQIDNIRLFVDQQDIYLQSQQSEIDSLNDQLGTVEAIKQGMSPMMLRMAVKIEDAINADMPFLKEQRLARVQRLKNTLGDPAVSPAEQYRQVLNLYKQEVSFGQGLESYEGAHPSKANSIVNYLRYGRVSLVYMTKDESEIARYNMSSGAWEAADGVDALQIRRAIRIAKGEAAPDVVVAPVTVGAN